MRQRLIHIIAFFYQRRLWITIILFAFLASLFLFKTLMQQHQHDFATYYYAGKAFTVGSNPYNDTVLYALSQKDIMYPFFYPPVILPVLSYFSFVNYTTASYIFLFLKLMALAGLLFIWGKHFCNDPSERTLMLIFVMLAYHHSVLQDFDAGNITIFEQLALWLGFLELLRKNYFFFVIAFALSCMCKPLSLLLLIPLAFVLRKQEKWDIVILCFLLFLMYHGISAFVNPTLTKEFLTTVHLPDERGFKNASSLAIIKDVIYSVITTSPAHTTFVPFVLYGFFAIGILLLGFFVLRRLDLQEGIMCSLFMFTLISPRFKDYTYITLIACTYFFEYQSFITACWFFGIFVWDAMFKDNLHEERYFKKPESFQTY
jgi:hypothetical protein